MGHLNVASVEEIIEGGVVSDVVGIKFITP